MRFLKVKWRPTVWELLVNISGAAAQPPGGELRNRRGGEGPIPSRSAKVMAPAHLGGDLRALVLLIALVAVVLSAVRRS